MKTTSMNLSDLDKDRHLFSIMLDFIICGEVCNSDKFVTLPRLKIMIEIIYAGLIAIKETRIPTKSSIQALLTSASPL